MVEKIILLEFQFRVVNSDGTAITSTETLYKTEAKSTTLAIKNGYLNEKNIKFQFRGNNPKYGRKADVA